MNVLIVQQLAWGTRVGHEIARVLAGEGHRLSAFVHGLESLDHVTRQRDVPYASVHFVDPLYDEDGEHVSVAQVAEIENRYGLTSIWRIVYCDRLLVFTFLDSRHFLARKPVSNDHILSVCWKTYRFVRDVIEQVKPAWVLAPSVGSLASYFLYLECRRAGIPFFSIGFARFGGQFYIADTLYLGSTRITERFQALRQAPNASPHYEEAVRLHAAIRRNDPDARPAYMARLVTRSGRPLRQALERAQDVVLFPARVARALVRPRRVMGISKIWMPANSRWNAVRNVWVNLRERFVATNHQGECLTDPGQITFPYVYFPLHVEPELSLLVFAPEHSNQLELCRRIALGLPSGVRLLVKEHPSMLAARPRTFYDQLRGLPNVEIAHSRLSSSALVTNPCCRASVVVSSTVGFEAAMSGRPVVLLAPVQYAVLPGVTLARSIDEAVERLQALCTAEPAPEPPGAEPARLAYLCAVLEQALPVDYERWRSGRGAVDGQGLVAALHARLGDLASGSAALATGPTEVVVWRA
jgi:Capsule polysaccharide biosynthesis protein